MNCLVSSMAEVSFIHWCMLLYYTRVILIFYCSKQCFCSSLIVLLELSSEIWLTGSLQLLWQLIPFSLQFLYSTVACFNNFRLLLTCVHVLSYKNIYTITLWVLSFCIQLWPVYVFYLQIWNQRELYKRLTTCPRKSFKNYARNMVCLLTRQNLFLWIPWFHSLR